MRCLIRLGPHLVRRYRVLRFDVRGFGRSTPMPRDYDGPYERIGDDLVSLTNQLNIERFRLVSAKVGGMTQNTASAASTFRFWDVGCFQRRIIGGGMCTTRLCTRA